MKYFNNPERMTLLLGQMLEGLQVTLTLFALTLLIALPLGLLFAMIRMSRIKFLRFPIWLLILIMRGTPLILQVFTVYFVLPQIFGMSFDRMTAVVISFAINYAAYFAEIYRSGVEGIPQGQREAAHVLGMSRAQAFFRIILPQVIKRIMLPVSNEVITLVKDTALVTAIGMVELYRVARNATSASGSLEPLFVAGIFYLILNTVVTAAFDWMGRRLDYYKG